MGLSLRSINCAHGVLAKTRLRGIAYWTWLGIWLLSAGVFPASAVSLFTYQGRLNVNGVPANGPFDFQFRLFDAATAGNQIDYTQSTLPVVDGLFSVALHLGDGMFTGPDRWLEITVRTNALGGYTTLSPRQPLLPTPYAIYAQSAGQAVALVNPGTIFTNASATSAGVLSSNDYTRLTISTLGQRIESKPSMGALTWYWLGANPTEAAIKSQFDVLYDLGLVNYGWNLVIVDDGWQATNRVNGRLTWNTNFFPSGIPALAAYAHARGCRLGLYTDDGPLESNAGRASTPADKAEIDAADFAAWGVDYVKYDIYNQGNDSEARLNVARRFVTALRKATSRPVAVMSGGFYESSLINFNVAEIANVLDEFRPVVDWGQTGGPFTDWVDFVVNYVTKPERYAYVIRPGHFVNLDHQFCLGGSAAPDFPAATWTNLTRGSFTMAAVLNCPLNPPVFADTADLFRFSVFTNRALIAIDQDALCLPARRVISNATGSVWVKQLSDGSRAVAWMNAQTNASYTATINWAQLGFDASLPCRVYDVWQYTSTTATNSFTATAPFISCALFLITPAAYAPYAPGGASGGILSDGSVTTATIASNAVAAYQLQTTGTPAEGEVLVYSSGSLAWQIPAYPLGARLTNLFLYGSASNTPALTVAADNYVTLGQTKPSSYPFNTAPNIFLGVNFDNYNGILGGGPDIVLPDRGGLRWKDGGAIWGWADHSSIGGELQINGSPSIAIQPGGNTGGLPSLCQLGTSLPTHEHFNFQYDDNPNSSQPLGHSKNVSFVARSWNGGPALTTSIPGIMGWAAGTNYTAAIDGGLLAVGGGELRFYSQTPNWLQNRFDTPPDDPGLEMGRMLTNGWNLRGKLIQERKTATLASTTYALDFNSAVCLDLSLTRGVTFTSTNWVGGATNFEQRTVLLHSGTTNRAVTFPSAWKWARETGAGTAPTNLPALTGMLLTLRSVGLGESNIIAHALYFPDP